jgi:hypothetical protein
MDTGEVWVIRYEDLLSACHREPALLTVLHAAMSRQIGRDRDSLMSICTLPADARVADFLRYWAESLSTRGMRTDQITLRMTRAEIGNYLGLTLEDGQPGAVAAGSLQADRVRREGPARDQHPGGRRTRRIRAAVPHAGAGHVAVGTVAGAAKTPVAALRRC